MKWNDIINAAFEGGMGCMVWFSIIQLYRDKLVRGIHPVPMIFVNVWGWWNIIYYSSLGQWLSFSGGLLLTVSNTIQTAMTLWYLWREHHVSENSGLAG